MYRNKLNHILRSTEKGHETIFKTNKNNLNKSWLVIKDIIGKHKKTGISWANDFKSIPRKSMILWSYK